MRIGKIEVSNFRALREAELDCTGSTVIIGENNSGKSAFLKALDLFYEGAPKVKDTDFSDGKIDRPIKIRISFIDLVPSERERFESNLINGELVVTRTLLRDNSNESGKFTVDALVYPPFSDIRNETGKRDKIKKYHEIADSLKLPKVKNSDQIEPILETWEIDNSDQLELQTVGSFRGFQGVAVGQLNEHTSLVMVPAVSDAGDEINRSAKSPVKELVNAIARQTITNTNEYKEFISTANERIADLTNPENVPALKDISANLSTILKRYYMDSSLLATWAAVDELEVRMPTAEIGVVDNGFKSGIDGVGHGLQRAIILTVLEFIANQNARSEGTQTDYVEAASDLIIAIEEPEIYQHPTKQRVFAKVLRRITEAFSKETGIRIQVLQVTHCPAFIDFRYCDDVRLVRRTSNAVIDVSHLRLEDCSKIMATSLGKSESDAMSAKQFGAKLHIVSSDISEGFFARKVILVEGVGNKAVLEAAYSIQNRDPLDEGIVIANVEGKTKLDKPAVIFRSMNIPTYIVFDNDNRETNAKKLKAEIKTNKLLQRVMGVSENEAKEWPVGVQTNWASWDGRLEKYIRSVVGQEKYDVALEKVSKNYGFDQSECLKSPVAAASVMVLLQSHGIKFKKLEEIITAVDQLTMV